MLGELYPQLPEEQHRVGGELGQPPSPPQAPTADVRSNRVESYELVTLPAQS
jgi:hypothetical protein